MLLPLLFNIYVTPHWFYNIVVAILRRYIVMARRQSRFCRCWPYWRCHRRAHYYYTRHGVRSGVLVTLSRRYYYYHRRQDYYADTTLLLLSIVVEYH